MSRITRRKLLLATAGLLGTFSGPSFGDAPKHAIVGYLDVSTSNPTGNWTRPIAARLKELGWIEGQNLTVERRFADGNLERLGDLAADLVRRKIHVIITATNPEAKAAMRATRTVPVVTVWGNDPVSHGLSTSIARPDGNVTGMLWADTGFHARRLQLLKEAIPSLTRLAALELEVYRHETAYTQPVEALAREVGVTIKKYYVSKPEDVTAALELIGKEKFVALHSDSSGPLATRAAEILAFAASNKLFDYYIGARLVLRGGLMSYAPRLSDNARRAAEIVDKILRGAKPAEVPFEYPKHYDLVINLKSARERGITIPQSILLRATQVIE